MINFKQNKIYNLDSLKYLKYIKNNSIDLIITDPPYGINYSTNRRKNKTRGTEDGIFNDKNNIDFIDNIIKELYRILKPGRHIYWFGRFDSISKHIPLFEKYGFIIKNNLIWLKNNHGTGDLYYSYASKYECILYAIKPGKEKFKLKEFNGIKRHTDILEFNKISSKLLLHDHQKPTDLLEFLINKSSNENELILDPFMGSGQTAFASLNNKRNYIGFELNKDIWKMAQNRFKTYTKNEHKIGRNFANILKCSYKANNINNIFDIDGKLNINGKIFNIDIQELNSQFFINKENLIFDAISVFYSKNKLKKRYKLEEFKELRKNNLIYLEKLGKLYTMNDNDIYLIYIKKEKLNNSNIKSYYEDNKYIYLPFKVKDLKNYIENNKNNIYININDKSLTKDTWESAYFNIPYNKIKDLILKPKEISNNIENNIINTI